MGGSNVDAVVVVDLAVLAASVVVDFSGVEYRGDDNDTTVKEWQE